MELLEEDLRKYGIDAQDYLKRMVAEEFNILAEGGSERERYAVVQDLRKPVDDVVKTEAVGNQLSLRPEGKTMPTVIPP